MARTLTYEGASECQRVHTHGIRFLDAQRPHPIFPLSVTQSFGLPGFSVSPVVGRGGSEKRVTYEVTVGWR